MNEHDTSKQSEVASEVLPEVGLAGAGALLGLWQALALHLGGKGIDSVLHDFRQKSQSIRTRPHSQHFDHQWHEKHHLLP